MRSNLKTDDQDTRSFIETARRAQIIDCAVETIAELGFVQTSLAKIAKRAGISTGVISYYFAGKDDLIAEVVAHVFAAGEVFIREEVGDPPTARETLRAFIEASVAYIAAHPHNAAAVMNIIRGGRTEQGGQRFDPHVGDVRVEAITRICEWGQREGEFRAFSIPVLRIALIEALDAAPSEVTADPDLDLAAYGRELAELFDRATRKDA
jgi:AcrR family transcriptional regulator